MGFLGPVTPLDGRLVRPHDIELLRRRSRRRDRGHGHPAAAHRLRGAGRTRRRTSEPWVQLTRGQAESLGLEVGNTVWLRPARDASMLDAAPQG